ncbi:MAG TPA: hypothetical protein VMR34_04940 [Candidatus Saccharimonadales bacterium]|nr:hypothetical protein [Candidatus Saccharimonadales bacterium]
MPGSDLTNSKRSKSEAKASRQEIEDYWQQKLEEAQASIRKALKEFDKGKINAFDVDHVINEYHKQSKNIYSFLNMYKWSNDNLPKILKMIQEEEKGNS